VTQYNGEVPKYLKYIIEICQDITLHLFNKANTWSSGQTCFQKYLWFPEKLLWLYAAKTIANQLFIVFVILGASRPLARVVAFILRRKYFLISSNLTPVL